MLISMPLMLVKVMSIAAKRAKIRGIIKRDLVGPRLVMEEGHCRWRSGIRESSESRIGRARQFEVKVGAAVL